MNQSNKLLSDIVAFRTYAKYLPHIQRRESLEETINRSMHMDLDKFPKLSKEIISAYSYVHDLKVMPSMRKMQFAGEAILSNNIRQYNCSFTTITKPRKFSEILFLLLSGTGVGYSVQNRHISQLPIVKKPREDYYYRVHDSIEGWASALDVLMNAYFFRQLRPQFDFSAIRPKGSYLVTTGAKAPGPEPLAHMLKEVEKILISALNRKLTDIEVHDLICIIADCVLAGGIRRAALISLFDKNSKAMLECKSGSWWEKHPYRARANNSAVLHRSETTEEEFWTVFNACKNSGAGEPGIFWTWDYDLGINPCAEIGLRPNQFCNLSTSNQTGVTTEKEFLRRIQAATTLGTIQAAYTDFPFLEDSWKQNTEEEALLGVSFTGIADASNFITSDLLRLGAQTVLEVNEKIAKKIGINLAARTTTVKPEGTSSTIFGSSSGIHDRHSKYYIRRVRMNKDDALAKYLTSVMPELVEDEQFSKTGVVVSIPIESPEGSITRNQSSAKDLFYRAMNYNKNWISPGHRSGKNKHNVSVTISVKEEEWEELGKLMWEYREDYAGISLLPYDGGTYVQAPFEEIDQSTYEKLSSYVKNVDLRNVIEIDDFTEKSELIACAGGTCTVEF